MRIIDEYEERNREVEFRSRVFNYIKERWKIGRVAEVGDFGYSINLHKRRLFGNVGSIRPYYGNKTIKVEVKKGYENFNDLKNMLKDLENKEKGFKVTLKILA